MGASYFNQVYTYLSPTLEGLYTYAEAKVKRSSESCVGEVLKLMWLAGYKAAQLDLDQPITHPEYGVAEGWQLTHLKQRTIYLLIWEFKEDQRQG